MTFDLFENVIDKVFVFKSYIFNICMYEQDSTLNNQHGLIFHKI